MATVPFTMLLELAAAMILSQAAITAAAAAAAAELAWMILECSRFCLGSSELQGGVAKSCGKQVYRLPRAGLRGKASFTQYAFYILAFIVLFFSYLQYCNV